LEHLFGLESLIIPDEGSKNLSNRSVNNISSKISTTSKITEEESSSWGSRILGRSWRDLIPVIKVEICCVRFFVSWKYKSFLHSWSFFIIRVERCLEIVWYQLHYVSQWRKVTWSTQLSLPCPNWIISFMWLHVERRILKLPFFFLII
jgi:hypothetical protein